MGRRVIGYVAALVLACAVVIAATKVGQQGAKASVQPERTVTAAVEREDLSDHQAAIIEALLEPLEGDCGLSQEDVDLIAAIIYLEAGGECAEGQQAVAEVIFNRLLSDSFPDTITEVIFQAGQFESVNQLDKAEPGETQYNAIREAIEGERILPVEVVFFSRDGENDLVWGRIGNHVFCYNY